MSPIQAFPSPGVCINTSKQEYQTGEYDGMLLRDYFAASAMSGLLSIAKQIKTETGESIATSVARQSYAVADAMLAARGEQ